MPLIIVLVLALIGGFALYENDADFRKNVDQFVEQIDSNGNNRPHNVNVDYASTAAGRPDVSRYRNYGGRPSASVTPGFASRRTQPGDLAAKNRAWRQQYERTTAAMRNNAANRRTSHQNYGNTYRDRNASFNR